MSIQETVSYRPIVGIIADRKTDYGHQAHQVLHGYVKALYEVSGVQPVILPASIDHLNLTTLAATLDGIVLTGSPSNIEASRYGSEPLPEDSMTDTNRDEAVLSLLPALLSARVPLLGICRGLQELNVLQGGSLTHAIQQQPGYFDHRLGDMTRPIDQWYLDKHSISIEPGGWLAEICSEQSVQVNTLHEQGIARLGEGLRIEAVAPDGLIEAISLRDASQFTLTVQWHPETRVPDSDIAHNIFCRFGQACAEHSAQRHAG
ncbi:gamma-glutamyl-gamma-aminobutyrate hydrolase family protein [Citrobacter portucalensis]|uniref:gamma-glutamyl-gamma-aminobutyrate hydrolase family protein n=1 Tax=Citrobacter portucalensis TaxID=1639133 RepID=UPI003314B17A